MIKRITDQSVTIEISHEDLLRLEKTLEMGNDTNEVIAHAGAFKDFEEVWYEDTYNFAYDLILECASVRREMDRSNHLTPLEVKRGFQDLKEAVRKVDI